MSEIRGLTQEEVRERFNAGQWNKPVQAPSKTIKEIIYANVFTYFNGVFLVLAIVLAAVGAWRDISFMPIIIANALIGIFQELRAKEVLDKLTVLNSPRAKVIREGVEEVVLTENLVLGDVVVFSAGDQIPADAEVIEGEVAVNEALLTGEADEIIKKVGAELMSGSFVISGRAYARLTKVGEESYVSKLTLQAKAIKSGEQSEILRALNKIVKIAGVAIIPVGIILLFQALFLNGAPLQEAVKAAVAAMIGMIPEGLFLLASVTLALSSMRLALDKVLVHDMKCIETLARVDVLCVDKTGTITETEMSVKEIIPVAEGGAEILRDFAAAQAADNATMRALQGYFEKEDESSGRSGESVGWGQRMPLEVTGFSSKLKYSAVKFEDGKYFLGAAEAVLSERGSAKVKKRISDLSKQGHRVLVLAKDKRALALAVLSNVVRESAPETFRYFAEQGVEIKVISGDDAETVSAVAKAAGIRGASKAVNARKLAGASDAEIAEALSKYVVFGRVTPEQKRKFVKILQGAGRTVAMTGDGVNDVLALKDADCSVAMAGGSDAAVQAAQLVLLESDFSKMPKVVLEGRRVVNNLERSGSLFLVKNVFSFLTALLSIIFGVTYPLEPAQISLISLWTIGIPGFLLSQIPSEGLIKGKFAKNILARAVPVALTDVVLVAAMVTFGHWIGIEMDDVSSGATLILCATGLIYLLGVSAPMNKWKRLIFMSCLAGTIFCIMAMGPFFGIKEGMDWLAIVLAGFLALFIVPLMRFLRRLMREIIVRFRGTRADKFVEKLVG